MWRRCVPMSLPSNWTSFSLKWAFPVEGRLRKTANNRLARVCGVTIVNRTEERKLFGNELQ